MGRWKEAADDFFKAIEGGLNDWNIRTNHALAMLAAGNIVAYRNACES